LEGVFVGVLLGSDDGSEVGRVLGWPLGKDDGFTLGVLEGSFRLDSL